MSEPREPENISLFKKRVYFYQDHSITKDREWWQIVKDFTYLVCVVSVVPALVAALVLGIGALERTNCHHKSDAIEAADWQWGYFAGCIVQVDEGGRWFPLGQYRDEVDR